MFVVRTSLHPSPIHGIGAFADEPIRAGQLVWQFDPRLDLCLPVEDLASFPEAVQEHIRTRAYFEERGDERVMVLCADNSQYVNHSSRPNLLESEDGLQEIAGFDIAVGEELTCDYFRFDLEAAAKLVGRRSASEPHRHGRLR